MVRMKDVAEHAGVSVATVSNVFTGKHFVTPEVRDRVLASVEALDYHINLNARGLKTSVTKTIGVVLPDITKLFFNDLLRGALDSAEQSGYRVTVLSSNYDYASERECISSLRSSNVDGIILDSCCSYKQLKEWALEIASYEGRHTPVVSLENSMDDTLISAVTTDSYYWSRKITELLIKKGKKKILFISGPSYLSHEHDRIVGYRQAHKDNGLPYSEDLIIKRDYSTTSSYDVMNEILKSKLKFDAVQASNDQAAIGAIKALLEHGIKIPDDIMVTGYDNVFPSSLIEPSVTTVVVPRYDIGYEAVKECLRHIEEPSLPPRRIVLNAHIIERGSTGVQDSAGWNLFYW